VDFFTIITFLVLYFIRPHEIMDWVQKLKPVTVSMFLALWAMFNRPGGFTVKNLFRTPHDWLMLLYFLWIVFAAPDPRDSFSRAYPQFVFYFVTVQALSSIGRIERFVSWWSWLVFAIAILALGGEFGVDLTGAYEITHGVMKDRLILNTSLFNNPNALGHSVVPCLMMLYYVIYWRRPVFSKVAFVLLIPLPLYCIYLTVSKGSFLSAFASLVLAYSFGRPKTVQITIIVLAVTIGYGALYNLPRMNELKKARQDPAIQGRIAAWQFGLDTLRNNNTGVGLGHFKEHFFRRYQNEKAGHSSYVQIGAEMGYTGLFLFLGILYCCVRTLVSAQATTTEEERVRRVLFVLLCSYFISSWMVDFGFRATYFLMAAAIAAFHREMLLKQEQKTKTEIEIESQPVSIGLRQLRPAGLQPAQLSAAMSQVSITLPPRPQLKKIGAPEPSSGPGGIRWNRIGVIDCLCIAAIVYGVVSFWAYIMRNI
jgi:O-antigen ligase